MHMPRLSLRHRERGFGVVELLLILVVVVVLAGAGWYVWMRHSNSKTSVGSNTSSSHPGPSPNPAPDPYKGWKVYTSVVGGFSLKYPPSWELSGFHDGNPVADSQVNGRETEIRIVSNSVQGQGARVNNFGIQLNVMVAPGSKVGFDTYDNGTTATLANGITIWEEKEQINSATGPSTDTCPTIQVGNDDSYSMQLANGKYLSVFGSFCWGQGQTTTESYTQQMASAEWNDAVNLVKSISFSH